MKTDRRDARTLADACRLDAYHPAHRTSAAQRAVRAELTVREALVRPRTRSPSVIRALLRRGGIRVPSGSAAAFVRRLAQVEVPPAVQRAITPVVELLTPLNAAIAAADAGMARGRRSGRAPAGHDARRGSGDGGGVPGDARRRRAIRAPPARSRPPSGWCRASTARRNGTGAGR